MIKHSWILFILLPSRFSDHSPKKDQLLQLSKKYFPESYAIIKEYDEKEINGFATGDSLKDYVYSVCTIVHEGFHSYQNFHSSYYEPFVRYRINDTLSIDVKNQKTFPSRELNNVVSPPLRKKIFRYPTYVDIKDKFLVTQQFGILGLLEEGVAYYLSFSTGISLYNYFKDQYGWSDPGPWMAYLSNIASYRFAIGEFELFISWYLQVAKKDHPLLYKSLLSDPAFIKLVRLLHRENQHLGNLYSLHLVQIQAGLGDRVEVRDGYIFDNRTHKGQGLYDKETAETNALLSRPEHREFVRLVE